MTAKNVLLITVDSIRADHVPLVQDGKIQTNTFEKLAADGISFDSAFATGPATAFSFPGILTGTLSLSHGGVGPLESDRPRLSRWMRDAGLQTAGFQSNPFLSTHYNYDEGFDKFEDYQNPLMGVAMKLFPRGIELNSGPIGKVDEYVDLTGKIKSAYQLVKGKPRPYVNAETITDDVLEWLPEQSNGFFCWAHYMDVHHPCYPPREYRKRFNVEDVTQSQVSEWYSRMVRTPEDISQRELTLLERLYAASIAYTDAQTGRICEYLRRKGMYDDTLIVLTSDHGELFGEYGLYGKPERMFDELLKVPLIVANGPTSHKRAKSELVSLLDVPGIIFDALDMDFPTEYQGTRLGHGEPREYVIAEHQVEADVVLGVRSPSHLYEIDELRNERRAFTIKNGTMNRIRTEEVPVELRHVAEDRISELNRESTRVDDGLETDVESRLEELGYL